MEEGVYSLLTALERGGGAQEGTGLGGAMYLAASPMDAYPLGGQMGWVRPLWPLRSVSFDLPTGGPIPSAFSNRD